MNLLKLFLTLSIVSSILFNAFGQENLITESETHIFWQENTVLTSKDFQGDCSSNPKLIKYCEELNLCVSAYVGVFVVLDIPKKKRNRGKLIEKAYFAPAFEKTTSCIMKLDSLGIKKQEVVFDIYELSARFARRELANFQDSVGAYGIILTMFKSVEMKSIEMRNAFVDSYTQDIYINDRDGAFEEWRVKIDKLLEETKKYATKPEDCYRFVKNEPIDENYKMAETVVGNLY
ncbi:hypothetical protein ACFLSE_10595 [Bacteroidota bacterium]